jgi:hypothetical protein
MKQLSTILLAIIIFSCSKSDINKASSKTKILVFQEDDFGVSKNLRTIGKGHGKGRPPRDTVVVDDPPTPTYNGQRIFHIDTDGELVSGTSWNWMGNIAATPSSMSETQINEVVDSVKKAYAFNSNLIVTRDVVLYNLCPLAYRQKIILTDYSDWYGNAGGVAFMYSFGSGTPCWVFSKLLGNRTKDVVLATAHELGHTVGLPHKVVGYYDATNKWIQTSNYSYDWNWMGAGYSYPYHIFETDAVIDGGYTINQPQTIINTLSQ